MSGGAAASDVTKQIKHIFIYMYAYIYVYKNIDYR